MKRISSEPVSPLSIYMISLVPYTRMRTRKVGGGNARSGDSRHGTRTLTEICQSQSDCSIRGIEFLSVDSYILGVTLTSRPTRRLSRRYCLQQATKGFVERHDVCVGLPTGGWLLVTVLLPASSFLFKSTLSNAVHLNVYA